jgi:5-methylcytosine-specific restriction endonuclease McrA
MELELEKKIILNNSKKRLAKTNETLISEILELLVNNNVPIPEIDNILLNAIKLSDIAKMKIILTHRSNSCLVCGATDINLQMHHVQHQSNHPELKHDLNNVILLCPQCHKASHNKIIEQPKGIINRIIEKERKLIKLERKKLLNSS